MKRWLLTALFALALCLCLTPAQAAEGEDYLWYVEGYGTLMLSHDGGASYAQLPGLGEHQAQTGENFSWSTSVTALPSGGVRVEARDKWAVEPSFQRDYSANQVAAALSTAQPAPIRVLCTNERDMTLGVRAVFFTENYVPTGDIMADWRYTQAAYQLVYTTDGVTWQVQPWPEGMDSAGAAWWDGTDFYLYDKTWSGGAYKCLLATSSDGLDWTVTTILRGDVTAVRSWSRGADLGPYHFDFYNGEVYLMDPDNWSTGVLLPHMGEGLRAKGNTGSVLSAWYGPDSTVFLSVYDYTWEDRTFTLSYPTSSLDWCLENLSVPFREPETILSNADGSVALAAEYGYSSAFDAKWQALLRNDGSGWKRVKDVPFPAKCSLLPYNGNAFVVADQTTGMLYFSTDGLTWTASDAARPADWTPGTYNRVEYATAWTGKGYIVARKAWEYGHGPMSALGKDWFEGNTKVYFLNEAFQLADAYDFGRLVEGVGYYDGNYYAKVSNSTGTTQNDWAEESQRFQRDAGSTLYTSKDGKTWTALPDTYLDIEDVFVTRWVGEKRGNLPTGDPTKPLRTVAQLDGWRFVLHERTPGYFDVYLLRGNANDLADLNMEQDIKSRWITPGELTAAYTADGNVQVTVQDLSTPEMQYSAVFTPQELDAMRDEGTGDWAYRDTRYGEEQKSNGVDVGLIATMNGEKEVVYRNTDTKGKYMPLESVPWSNSVELLSYSGKDFMVLDKADGKLYLSSDGMAWREATGGWITANRDYECWDYAFCWVGDHYIAACALGKDGAWAEDGNRVILLDSELNQIGVSDWEGEVTALGYWDGVCYLRGDTIFRSPDGGRTWQPSDLAQVRECLADVALPL